MNNFWNDWQLNRALLTLRLNDITIPTRLSYAAWQKCATYESPIQMSQTGYCIYDLENDPNKKECVICSKPYNRE